MPMDAGLVVAARHAQLNIVSVAALIPVLLLILLVVAVEFIDRLDKRRYAQYFRGVYGQMNFPNWRRKRCWVLKKGSGE